jgi:hypothetical protein
MAAHNFYRNDWVAGTRRLTTVFFTINTGASGAVSSFTSKKEGISNITRSSAGRYLCTLDQKYKEVIGVDACTFITGGAAYTAGKAANGYVIRDASTNVFTLQMLDNTNTDGDVQDNAIVKVAATMRDS